MVDPEVNNAQSEATPDIQKLSEDTSTTESTRNETTSTEEQKKIDSAYEEARTTNRVTVQVLESDIVVGGIHHTIRVMAVPGAVSGMHFEAYKQLEMILSDAVDHDKVMRLIDPVITKALPALKKGITASMVMSILQLFRGMQTGGKIYHGKVEVQGTNHLSDLLRKEIAGKKIHTAVLMKFIRENFMEIVSVYPDLGDLFMSVIGLGEEALQKKNGPKSVNSFFK